jgi:Kef-type K+ transport system membrane component KefB
MSPFRLRSSGDSPAGRLSQGLLGRRPSLLTTALIVLGMFLLIDAAPTLASLGTAPGSGPSPADVTASEGESLGTLTALFVLLLGAKGGEEVMRRLGQPGVIGELLGGFLVGPHALGLVNPGETEQVFAMLGVVVLLFAVGLEVRTDDLLAVGKPAFLTAVIAMVLPIGAGIVIALGVGEPPSAAVFVGLALAATSIGITSKVLSEFGVLNRPFARIIIGAALVDDILALLLIGIAVGAAEGDLSASTLLVAVFAIGLLGLGFATARRVRGLRREVFMWPMFAQTPLVPAFGLMLATALLAGYVGLAAIVGAFIAGLIVAETEAREEVELEFRSLASVFTPFFFAVTGAQIDLAALLQPETAILAVALGVAGILTKLIGGILGSAGTGRWAAITVGAGMSPRGEVGIVVANLALGLGMVDQRLFSAILVAVMLTTVVAPYTLAFAIPRAIAESDEIMPEVDLLTG